jgi:two-component system NtrC family response regulator
MLLSREGIIGESPAMKACLELVAQAAVTETAVLITGETGTGKELIARTIHKNSLRHDNLFVVVDCASLPESLIESALFGHHKGASPEPTPIAQD